MAIGVVSNESPEKIDDGTISVKVSFTVKFRNQTV